MNGLSLLDDAELIRRTEELAAKARSDDASLLEHLAEIDRRRLYPGGDYRSLFEYCVHRMKMSEGSAYRRIRAARTIRAHPDAVKLLRSGRITIEGLALLHNAVGDEDFHSVLTRAAGQSTRRIEAMLADRAPEDAPRDVLRFLGPAPATTPPDDEDASLFRAEGPSAATPEDELPPLPPSAPHVPEAPRRRVRLAFTADHRFYVALEKARALLRHKYPDGRLEALLFDAMKALLDKKDPGLRWAPRGRTRPGKV